MYISHVDCLNVVLIHAKGSEKRPRGRPRLTERATTTSHKVTVFNCYNIATLF